MATRRKRFPWEGKLLRSGYLLGAVLLHLIVFVLLAGYVVFRSPPPEPTLPFARFNPLPPVTPVIHPPVSVAGGGLAPVINLDTGAGAMPAPTPNMTPSHDDIRVNVPAGSMGVGNVPELPGTNEAPRVSGKGMSMDRIEQIRPFLISLRPLDKIRQHDPSCNYPVYVASYADGDWACNISFDDQGNIVAGSLPNLVAKISEWTHHQVNGHVMPHPLNIGGPELAEQNPPFIFLTGHKDFVLTPQEVENLREYVVRGGLIWGDNALAGGGSRFDVAFRREMKRVIPSEPFQTLATDAEIFHGRYAFEQAPEGMNYRAEPIEHVDLDGQIAILYTPDDYSDLYTMRILPGDAQIQGVWPATDSPLVTPGLFLYNRTIFFRNYTLPSSLAVQHLGLNIVTFLITRFDDEMQLVP